MFRARVGYCLPLELLQHAPTQFPDIVEWVTIPSSPAPGCRSAQRCSFLLPGPCVPKNGPINTHILPLAAHIFGILPLRPNPALVPAHLQTAAMDFQTLELTVEDILNLHRGWITELYIHDRRTDVEIVALLQEERQLPVT